LHTVQLVLLLIGSYFIGSIPSGLIIVRLITGKDIRHVESGRTGGTNAARAAGLWAGLGTAFFDGLKAALAVWVAKALFPLSTHEYYAWAHVAAAVMAILGHNYSLFLIERKADGRLHFRGGAGGAPCVGGSIGLWIPSLLVIIPVAAILLFGVGYASLATLSVGIVSSLLFAYLAVIGKFPWIYAAYGILAEVLLILSLAPNIKRLIEGNERLVGWRAKRKERSASKHPTS
jgi:glycerol-3-phosphate acyltransferase PlsY